MAPDEVGPLASPACLDLPPMRPCAETMDRGPTSSVICTSPVPLTVGTR